MKRMTMLRSVCALGLVIALVSVGGAMADPPPPDSSVCPPVQCFMIDSVLVCTPAGDKTLSFTTLNWYATTPDAGVDELRITALSGNTMSIVSATAPPGWTVSLVTATEVRYVTTTAPIPEVDMCNNNCAPLNCGNIASGFQIAITNWAPGESFRANWQHLSGGVDNGDVMNFGAMRWVADSTVCTTITELYSNVPYGASVPALDTWALIALVGMICAFGGAQIIRKIGSAS